MHAPTLPSIVVINRDDDTDRLAHMQSELAKSRLAFQRFPALGAEEALAGLPHDFREGESGALLSPGEIGCYGSHLALCRQIASGALPAPTLVLEDDVALAGDFADFLVVLLARLPSSWDLVRLANPTKRAFSPVADLGHGRRLIRYSLTPDGTGALLWSRAGAAKFARQSLRTLAVDQDLSRVWAWRLDAYGVTPAPIERDVLETSVIEHLAPQGWRSVPWRKAAMRRWRSAEALQRHLHGVRTLGMGRWLELLRINTALRFTRGAERAGALERMCWRLSEASRSRSAQARPDLDEAQLADLKHAAISPHGAADRRDARRMGAR